MSYTLYKLDFFNFDKLVEVSKHDKELTEVELLKEYIKVNNRCDNINEVVFEDNVNSLIDYITNTLNCKNTTHSSDYSNQLNQLSSFFINNQHKLVKQVIVHEHEYDYMFLYKD